MGENPVYKGLNNIFSFIFSFAIKTQESIQITSVFDRVDGFLYIKICSDVSRYCLTNQNNSGLKYPMTAQILI